MLKARFYSLAFLLITFSLGAQNPDALHGHLMAPTKIFFDKAGSRAITVGLADVVLWDLASGKPLSRVDLANNIREYNPFTSTTLGVNGFATPDLSRVLVELYGGDLRYGFIFDMNTGKLSADDTYFGDKAYGFDLNGDYTVIRNLRTNNGPPGQRLEIGLAGSTTTMGVLSEFQPTGASLDGKVVFGRDMKSDKLVIYDIPSASVKKTKLKFEAGPTYYYYILFPLIYSSQWVNVPGSYTKFYNVASGEILNEVDGLKGPYGFSDEGKYALYYKEGSVFSFVVKEVESKQEYQADWTSGLLAYLYNSRFIESSFQLYQLEGNPETQQGRIVIYDMKNGTEAKSFSVMADPLVIELNRSGRANILTQSNGQSQQNTQTTSSTGYDQAQKEDTGNHGYDSFEGLLINYNELSLPYTLNYNSLPVRDVSNYAYKDKISYGHLEGSSLNAIGKVFSAEGHIGLLSVYRRVQGSLDYSWFKISVFDTHGNHIQTENIGNMQRDASGTPFKVNFTVEDAGDKILINIKQKNMSGVEQKVMTVDKYTGSIK